MGKGSASAGALAPLRPVSELLDHLQEVTGGPVDAAVLGRALTHRSYAYEAGGLPHNERLEFLGDSVLGLVVTTTLYDAHPDTSEGQLAKLRAAVVNMRALADVGRTLGLGDYVYLGRGEESTGGRDKDSILADTVEAVIGAVYQSAGIEAAGELVHHLVDPLLAQSATLGAGLDWKTSLQEITSRHGLGAPEYSVTEDGPEHAKCVRGPGRRRRATCSARGSGRTKKVAEQEAAALAWTAIRDAHEGAGRRPRGGAAPGGRRRRARAGRARRGPCLSCPRSRSSAAASPTTCSAAPSPTSSCAATGSPAATSPAPRTSPTASPGAASRPCAGAASTSGSTCGDALGLILHLGMSGQLLVEDAAAPDEKHLHARFRFADDGPELRFVDQRTFGGLALTDLDVARHPDDDRAHRARPARAGLRPGRGRAPGQGQGQRDQAGAARPDAWPRASATSTPTRRSGARRCTASGSASALDQAAHRRGARPRGAGHARGARRGRHELRRALRQRQRRLGLLRPLARAPTARPGGPARGAARPSGASTS